MTKLLTKRLNIRVENDLHAWVSRRAKKAHQKTTDHARRILREAKERGEK